MGRSNTDEVAVRIDNKGRVTLPKNIRKAIRKALGIEIGDTVFLKYEPQEKQFRLVPAISPFDILAEDAIKECQEGRTKAIEDFVHERKFLVKYEQRITPYLERG